MLLRPSFEFGIVAAINIMVVFLLSLLLIPIVFSFLGDPKERHVKHLDRKWMNALVERLLQISLYHRSKVLLFTLFLLLAGFYGIGRMHSSGRFAHHRLYARRCTSRQQTV